MNSVNSVGGNHSKTAAWVRQDAIPSYICVNPCYLWETLLYKKVLCRSVKFVGGNHSEKVRVKSVGELFWLRGGLPSYRTDRQRMFSHRFHRFSQMVRVWNSVNSAFCGNTVLPRIALINTDGWLR